MQVLNSWLKAIRIDGMVLARARVTGAWGFAIQPSDSVVFHLVAEGTAFVRQANEEMIELKAGELVFFPHGGAHELVHAAKAKAEPLEAFLAKHDGVFDQSARANTLICGQFSMDQHLALPALRSLPQVVVLRAAIEPGFSPLSDTLRMLRNEVETSHFGNQIVVRNLLSALFIYFMRDWAETASVIANDWFSAVRSPHTARVLARMHESPEHAWTLEELAQEAGLSRAAFARHFRTSVGEPPHSYLTRWRMGIAAQLLTETHLKLSEIASRVGYLSEFSFSRAFKLTRGTSPIQYRRDSQRHLTQPP